MESGLPMLNCLLQHTLRSLCSCPDSSNSSKWVYAVFWRILPRNYPPPKWEYGGTALDRSKGNKRNWILVWEDGFCDFLECERTGSGYMKGRFGTDIFFKMSHEVYNFGEGLVGKVAADNSHKWVFRDPPSDGDPSLISSWNVSIEPQPRAWEIQFNSGIQTIAIISVREGVVQLGSFDKIVEDLNLVISIQRKFSYLQSIPGVFTIQRPCLPIQHPYVIKPSMQTIESHETSLSFYNKRQLTRVKRLFGDKTEDSDSPIKSINLGWNTPQNGIAGQPIWPIPPLLPTMPCSLGALLAKLPSVAPYYSTIEAPDTALPDDNIDSSNQRVRVDNGGIQTANMKLEYSSREGEGALNLN
ncbi:protein RICE SALT SENSITIVE 3-like isoform X2 [Alnus glutinosa]|uniref:protein RICE SALT SENSITIVE 3-like isoform X2 n=1 Tax=Alnus glutinosa TaxID=3517 RepID=UPI002D77D757|nr:protein RICE SALT SENSITIVE 3-like isoform X2 [Alnus glutinosa]